MHVAPIGSPEQLKETVEWKALSGVRVTVAVVVLTGRDWLWN